MRVRWPAVVYTWGSTPDERRMPFPCDEHVPDGESAWRAVDVDAPPPVLFRWLCQLKAAPYSYDWIDNLGRRSPRELTAGLDELALGQRFMGMFELVAFEPEKHLTLLARDVTLFGDVAVTYMALARGSSGSRLVVKLVARPRCRLRGPLLAGDLVMMRKQLLTLKKLAQGESRSAKTAVSR